MRILLVEPDIVSRTMLQRILGNFGELTIAADNDEALKQIRKSNNGSSFTLACIERSNEMIDCKIITKEIKSLNQKTKIISISDNNDLGLITSGFNEECDGFMFRPFTVNKVKKLINELELNETA